MVSPSKNNVALRYLDNLNDSPSKLPLQPTLKHNSINLKKSYPEEDLDKLARQLDIDPVSTPTKTALLRTKYETPSVTVSSFKTPSSNTSSRSGSPIKRNYRNFETPIKKPSDIPDLKKASNEKPYLSSPSNSTSTDSPGYEYLCRIASIKEWLEKSLEKRLKNPLLN